jgi:Zn-dependent protease
MTEAQAVQQFSVWILPVIFAVTLHEAAHGFAALRLGDRTAYMLGRVTLNPVKHIDPFGTLLFPGVALLLGAPLFGWAKPVPVNFAALRHPRRDSVLVALAGPGMNILLSLVSMLLLYAAIRLPDVARLWAVQNLKNSAQLNVVLAVFNMLPIPPLDGGRVAMGILPRRLGMVLGRLEPYGIPLVLGLFVLVPMLLGRLGPEWDPFLWLVGLPAGWLEYQLAWLVGLAA